MGSRAVIDNLNFRAGILCLFVALCAEATAETAYVTDRLQLGVHAQADALDKAFAKLKSGERVDVTEENRYHARVKLPDGRTGWVKKTYLVSEKPAILRVTEVEQERDKAMAELESLRSSLSGREARVSKIEGEIQAREAAAAADSEDLERLRKENFRLTDRLQAYSFSVPGSLFSLAAAASFLIGCLLSWWWFDRRSRKRHGGFRIH